MNKRSVFYFTEFVNKIVISHRESEETSYIPVAFFTKSVNKTQQFILKKDTIKNGDLIMININADDKSLKSLFFALVIDVKEEIDDSSLISWNNARYFFNSSIVRQFENMKRFTKFNVTTAKIMINVGDPDFSFHVFQILIIPTKIIELNHNTISIIHKGKRRKSR